LDSTQARQLQVVPEPLIWDASRLATVRDTIDRIALESALLIAAKQVLAPYRVLSAEADEVEFQIRIDVLLSDGREIDISILAGEVERFVTHAIHRARENERGVGTGKQALSPRSPRSPITVFDAKELCEKAEKCVKDSIAPGNPVLNLLTKRVYKVILCALIKQPYLHKLSSFSLASRAQERNWKSALDSITNMFNHNWAVYGALYRSVLAALCDSLTAAVVAGDVGGEVE
jgi:hypothetical protein